MTNEKGPQTAVTVEGQASTDKVAQLQNTPLGDLVASLMVRMHQAEKEIRALKRKSADSYDWSQDVPRGA